MANPLTIVDDAVIAALAAYTPLTAIIPATMIRRYDRRVDIRQIERSPQPKGGIWVIPRPSPIQPYYGGGQVQWVLNYDIGLGLGSDDAADMRAAQYEIARAMLLLCNYTIYTSTSVKTAYDPTPWEYISITPTRSDVTHAPPTAPSTKWEVVFQLTVNLSALDTAIQ